jgi:hypothetical protein
VDLADRRGHDHNPDRREVKLPMATELRRSEKVNKCTNKLLVDVGWLQHRQAAHRAFRSIRLWIPQALEGTGYSADKLINC